MLKKEPKPIYIFDKCIYQSMKWIFLCLLLCGLVFKAMYNFDDSPYFTFPNLPDLLCFIVIGAVFFCIIKYSDIIEARLNYIVLTVVFAGAALFYIFMVPLVPFSDMAHVSEGAQLIGDGNIAQIIETSYLQFVVKNLKVSLFYGFFAWVFVNSVLTFKILNIVLYILIAYYISKICNNYKFKYPKMIYAVVLGFLPLFLYSNHIYFDIPVLFFCTLALYFYSRDFSGKSMMIAMALLGFACCLRILALIPAIAILIDYILRNYKTIFAAFNKSQLYLLIAVLFIIGLPMACDGIVKTAFKVNSDSEESIWTNFYVGANEEEFGFTVAEFDEVRDFNDVAERIGSRNFIENLALYTKKALWGWTQGTYQAQRYAFGQDAQGWQEKFEYETPVTQHLLKDSSASRQAINSFARVQYMYLLALMVIGMWSVKNISSKRVFYVYLFGTFIVMIFYELKSRYMLPCLPIMVLLAADGINFLKRYAVFNHEKNDSPQKNANKN